MRESRHVSCARTPGAIIEKLPDDLERAPELPAIQDANAPEVPPTAPEPAAPHAAPAPRRRIRGKRAP